MLSVFFGYPFALDVVFVSGLPYQYQLRVFLVLYC